MFPIVSKDERKCRMWAEEHDFDRKGKVRMPKVVWGSKRWARSTKRGEALERARRRGGREEVRRAGGEWWLEEAVLGSSLFPQ